VDNIRLSGTLLADDHAAAALLHARVSRVVWIAFWPLALLLLVSGILRAVGTTAPPDKTLLLIAAFVVLLPLGRHFGIQRHARQLFAETKGAHRLDISLGEDVITVSNERGNWTLPWSDVHKWRSNEHCVLLYLNSALYLILPKRLLTDETALVSLEEKLRATVGRPA